MRGGNSVMKPVALQSPEISEALLDLETGLA